MDPLALYLSAPVASFRVPQAREYLETFPCPPPATVYGALLSLSNCAVHTRSYWLASHVGRSMIACQISTSGASVSLSS